MSISDFDNKLKIVSAAIDLHVHETEKYTIRNIAARAGLEEETVNALFNAKSHILPAYYSLAVQRFRRMVEEIDEFPTFTLEEKLSTFVYSMFDILAEEREFVEDSFDQLILNARRQSGLQQEVAMLLREFLESSRAAGSLQSYLVFKEETYLFLAREYLHLIKFWLRDDSEQFQATMALSDKLISLLCELVESGLIDKSVDLLKFFFNHNLLRVDLSFLTKWLKLLPGGRS